MLKIRILLAAPVALALALATPVAAQERTVPQSRTEMQLSFAPLVKQVENAVVNVYAERVVERRSIFDGDPFFEEFFGQRMPNRSEKQSSLGSGVIVGTKGIVVTNNHVIEGASDIKIALADGREYESTVVLKDERVDLAVLKIKADVEFTALPLGDSDAVQVGDLVLAIGNPVGVGQTVTSGIVSALARNQVRSGDFGFFIQTDASINPGNSGGGLFDQYGNLIGIVVAKSSGSDVEGLGFAIPVDRVETIVKSLIKNGYVTGRPVAGISIKDLTSADDAMQYGVSITGVYVAEVTGDNAKKAGIEVGDLVYYIDDEKVTSGSMLVKKIQEHKVGDEVVFTVVRNNDMKKITIKLEDSAKYSSKTNSGSSAADSNSNSDPNSSLPFGNNQNN